VRRTAHVALWHFCDLAGDATEGRFKALERTSIIIGRQAPARSLGLAPPAYAYRELNPAVLMMKSAEDGLSSELAEPLDRPMARGILSQGQMRSELVVVAGVRRKDLAQMGLAEDDDVIQAFAADRADQSLRMPVLPG